MKNQTFAARSFSAMGPKLWNDPPNENRSAISIMEFRKLLKTFLYQISYGLLYSTINVQMY